MQRDSVHGIWSSQFAFILAATGSAVGLGNIWKFPYITGEYGGGAFVLVYLLFVLILGIPVMMAEILLGRRGRRSPINTMRMLAREERATRLWCFPGYAGVLAGFLILSYYSVVAGEVIAYVFRAAAGVFENQTPDGVRSILYSFQGNAENLLGWHTIFVVMTMLVVARGVRSGLEKAVRFLMPLLVILLLMLVFYGMTSSGFDRAVRFLFQPDFNKLFYRANESGSVVFTLEGVWVALGHAFFTLSLGMGAIMVYGAYLHRDASIGRAALTVALADTSVGLLAGLAIFPIVFSNNMAPNAGPGLIFETLPVVFGAIPGGALVGTMFFALLLFAAWTSAISLIEPAVAWLVESRRWSRARAATVLGMLVWMLGIASIFSATGVTLGDIATRIVSLFVVVEHPLRGGIYDSNWFMLIDTLTTRILLPLGGLTVVLFVGWRMRIMAVRDEAGFASRRLFRLWYLTLRYLTPLAVLAVFIVGIIEGFLR